MLMCVAGPGSRLYTSAEPEPETFDFYIGPSGSDSNDGLTTGTPWAITALNTKRATYAGKRVGLLDGTYSTDGMPNSGGGSNPALLLISGSSGSPTVIQAVNARQAILDDNHYARSNHGAIMGLVEANAQYVEIRNLRFTRSSQVATFWYSTSGRGIGLKIVGCEFDNGIGWDADNTPYIYMSSWDDTDISDNYFRDLAGAASSFGCAAILNYGCKRTQVIHNTFKSTRSCINSKYASGSPRTDEQEHTFAENYCESMTVALRGFDNKDQTGVAPTSPPYPPYTVRNNVFVNCDSVLNNDGAFCASSQLNAYNNTVVQTTGTKDGWNLHTRQAGDGYEPSYYNNIYYHSGASWNEQGALTVSIDGAGASLTNEINYNCYGPSSAQWRTQTGYGYPYTAGGANYTTQSSQAAWQSATGKDGNSLFATDPLFTGTGTDAAAYQLQGGSPCLNAGRVGGTSGGATRHIGAWDGVVTQIGKDW
jgi:hypothetical protein